MVKPQDLLLVQLLQTTSLCWLRKRGLPSFHFNSVAMAGEGTVELHFGIPAAHADSHPALVEDWLTFAKKTERLHVLLGLLSNTPDIPAMRAVRNDWMKEGTALRSELFDPDLPGVVHDMKDLISPDGQ